MARARVASIDNANRLPWPLPAASVSAASACRQRSGSRLRRTWSSRAICAVRTAALSTSSRSTSACLARGIFVDADDRLLAAVDRRLTAGGGLFDTEFRHAGFDRLGHAAHRLDLGDQRRAASRKRMGQAFKVIAAAQRIDDMR